MFLIVVAIFLFVGCPPTYKNAAKIYLGQSQYQKAKDQIVLGIEQTPGDFEYYCLLGKVEILLGNWLDGSKAFQDAFRIDTLLTLKWMQGPEKENLSSYWQNFYNCALKLSTEKKYDEALVELFLAKKIDPTNVSQFNLEGTIYAQMGNKEAAVNAYNKTLSIDPENPEAYYFIGNAMFEKKAFDSSIVQYTNSIKFFEKNYNQIKGVLFQNVSFDKALAFEIVDLWNGKKTEELNRVVKTKLGFDQPDVQKRNIEKFAKVTEGLAHGYYYRGMANYNLKKDSLALNDWNTTLDLVPNDLDALYYLAELLIVKFKKYDEAREHLEKIVAVKADDFTGWFYIGVCYAQVKNYKKAIEIYEDKALKYSPDNIDVLTNIAFAYRELGDNKKAIEYLMKIDQIQKKGNK